MLERNFQQETTRAAALGMLLDSTQYPRYQSAHGIVFVVVVFIVVPFYKSRLIGLLRWSDKGVAIRQNQAGKGITLRRESVDFGTSDADNHRS